MPTKYSHLSGKEMVMEVEQFLLGEGSVSDFSKRDKTEFFSAYIDKAIQGDENVLLQYVNTICGEPE